MDKQAQFKLVVSLQGETREYPLGHVALDRLTGALDTLKDAFLWDAFAAHPSYEVRQMAAYQDFLSPALLDALAEDPVVAVRETVFCNESYCQRVSLDTLLRHIKTDDVAVVRQIVHSLSDYKAADTSTLADALAKHPDPTIRLALAESGNLDNGRIKKLAADRDVDTSLAARRALEE